MLGLKESLQLILDHRRFEEQCFDINKALIEHKYLIACEDKKKFITVMKKDREKRERKKKNDSSWIVETFSGFDIASNE